jgi:hypothetical protein
MSKMSESAATGLPHRPCSVFVCLFVLPAMDKAGYDLFDIAVVLLRHSFQLDRQPITYYRNSSRKKLMMSSSVGVLRRTTPG